MFRSVRGLLQKFVYKFECERTIYMIAVELFRFNPDVFPKTFVKVWVFQRTIKIYSLIILIKYASRIMSFFSFFIFSMHLQSIYVPYKENALYQRIKNNAFLYLIITFECHFGKFQFKW